MTVRSSFPVRFRTLVLVGGLAGAILPAAVFGIGSAIEARRASAANEAALSHTIATNLASHIDQVLSMRLAALGALGDAFAAGSMQDTAAMEAVIKLMRDRIPGFYRVSITGLDGRVIATAPSMPGVIGFDTSDQDFFQEVLATKAPAIAPGVVGLNDAPRIIVGVPMMRGGDVRGVVVAAIELASIQADVAKVQYKDSGRVMVVDAEGKLIAHPDPEMVKARTDYSNRPIWQFVGAGDSGEILSFSDQSGNERIGGFATVPLTGWKLWASISRAEVDAAVLRTYAPVLAWAFGAVAFAVLAAMFMASRIARPIIALRDSATAVADGDLSRRAPEEGPRELRDMSAAVNRMAASLQEKIETERRSNAALETAITAYSSFAARAAGGDLSARIPEADLQQFGGLGGHLNRMVGSLDELVREIGDAAASVASATAEILAATNQQLTASTEESAMIRQTAATVTEVRQTAEASARKTRMVADLSRRVASTTDAGRQSVEASVRSSTSARQRMETLSERILAFSEQVQAIADINAMVADLAENSNLLAVNAGIEAAKAGDAGRGFAVVATEVKELAERSREATASVRGIVVEIQKSAQAAVLAAEQGVKAADEGTAVAQRSGEVIAALATSVGEASEAAVQIIATAEQQEVGIDQIGEAIRNIEQSSVQTVAATQQVERAARDLNQLANKLRSLAEGPAAEAEAERIAVRRVELRRAS